jgi:hypothetical protein
MQSAVVPNAPPSNLRFLALQRQPGRDVGLMIHIRHDDLPPLAERLTHTQAIALLADELQETAL